MNSRLGQKKQEKLYMTENVAIALTLKLGVICHEEGWRRRFMHSWASASRKLTPASAFQHAEF
jgi:hypothetical protein